MEAAQRAAPRYNGPISRTAAAARAAASHRDDEEEEKKEEEEEEEDIISVAERTRLDKGPVREVDVVQSQPR